MDLNCLKPELEIFQTVVNRLQIDPHRCILIDDHIENIRAAKACGWQTILHINPKQTRQELGRIHAQSNLSTR